MNVVTTSKRAERDLKVLRSAPQFKQVRRALENDLTADPLPRREPLWLS